MITPHSEVISLQSRRPTIPEIEGAESHRWMVQILAEMIEYSEARQLHAIAAPLLEAIERISPLLVDEEVKAAAKTDEPMSQMERREDNVLEFRS